MTSGRTLLASVCVVALASSAAAQSPYVGGALIADVARFSGSNGDTVPGNGEAIGGAVRAGVPLGNQWGVDLEFTRSGEIETTPDVRILAQLVSPGGIPEFIPQIFPPPDIRNRQQLSTLATTVWRQQYISERFDLMYLGGVAFNRIERSLRIGFAIPDINLPAIPRIDLPPPVFQQESVSYGAGVIVGLDARVGMTEHLRLVPGARLLTASPGGWVVRPAVGVQWVW